MVDCCREDKREPEAIPSSELGYSVSLYTLVERHDVNLGGNNGTNSGKTRNERSCGGGGIHSLLSGFQKRYLWCWVVVVAVVLKSFPFEMRSQCRVRPQRKRASVHLWRYRPLHALPYAVQNRDMTGSFIALILSHASQRASALVLDETS